MEERVEGSVSVGRLPTTGPTPTPLPGNEDISPQHIGVRTHQPQGEELVQDHVSVTSCECRNYWVTAIVPARPITLAVKFKGRIIAS